MRLFGLFSKRKGEPLVVSASSRVSVPRGAVEPAEIVDAEYQCAPLDERAAAKYLYETKGANRLFRLTQKMRRDGSGTTEILLILEEVRGGAHYLLRATERYEFAHGADVDEGVMLGCAEKFLSAQELWGRAVPVSDRFAEGMMRLERIGNTIRR